MSGDHDDPLIARLWRDVSSEAPAPLLDARILQAARLQQRRRRLMPLAAALAACLVLALAATQYLNRAVPDAVRPAMAVSRLYEARATAELSNPQTMHEMQLRQMPGGSEVSEIVQPGGGP
jgi:hypothetical protein